MKQEESYIKDTGDEIPKGEILVTAAADVAWFYSSISHEGGLEVFRKLYDKFNDKMFPTGDITKIADFEPKNNILKFDYKFYQQLSDTAIKTLFAPLYAFIFMNYIEMEFFFFFFCSLYFTLVLNAKYKTKSNIFFNFLSGFSFTNIHESQDCMGRGRAFL